MILYHQRINRNAIEKYKDREVKIFHGLKQAWLGEGKNTFTLDKKEAVKLTFKEALKKTKTYEGASNIEYHFEDIRNLGETKPNINDFNEDEVYLCTTVKFDKYNGIHNHITKK